MFVNLVYIFKEPALGFINLLYIYTHTYIYIHIYTHTYTHTHLETNENENTTTQNLWDTAKTVLREIHSITSLPQEKRKSSNKQSNFTLKGTRKKS